MVENGWKLLKWLKTVEYSWTAYSSLFQPISTYSSLFQPIPAYSSLFKPIQAYPDYNSLFQPIPAGQMTRLEPKRGVKTI